MYQGAKTTMKAIRIHSYGDVDVMQYEDVGQPSPDAGEVLIKVHAASVNPVDRAVRAGYMQSMVPLVLPLTLGMDLAGVIEAIGDGVTAFAVGDAVYGMSDMMHQGAYAEYAVVPVAGIAIKPTSVDFVTASAVPLAGLTAWQALFNAAGLKSGQTVLIHGAGGGVGSFAVQFAANAGAHVLATAGSDKIALLRELGATEAIDYTKARFEDVARDVDVVFDTIGGEVLERSLAVLKRGGILVSIAGQPDVAAAEARGVRAAFVFTQANGAELGEIARMIDAGKVKPLVSTVLPLSKARKAHDLITRGHTRGKIVLRVVDAA